MAGELLQTQQTRVSAIKYFYVKLVMVIDQNIVDGLSGMKRLRIFKTITFTLLLTTAWAFADSRQEIDHLLRFVANTDCQYDRNGTIYNGLEARQHINMKYEYYKDRINTTEDFIKYSATKSKISGKKYKIYCPDSKPVYANDWLLRELKAYRRNSDRY